MRLLDRAPADITERDLLQLMDELNDLRRGRFAQVYAGSILVYLQAFYLPDDQTRFVPIGKANLLAEYWLLTTWDQLDGSPVRRLCTELIGLSGIQPDTVAGRKTYTVLNACMKVLCRNMIRPRKRRRN